MSNKIIDLKRCPFCGGQAAVIYTPISKTQDTGLYHVQCSKCFKPINDKVFENIYDAIAEWNERRIER